MLSLMIMFMHVASVLWSKYEVKIPDERVRFCVHGGEYEDYLAVECSAV